MSHRERVQVIDRKLQGISISRQADIIGISRSSLYTKPKENPEDKRIMDLIDEIYTKWPFYGSRRIRVTLAADYQIVIGRDHVRRLMRLMGIEAIYPKKKRNTSISDDNHRKYPYLLAGITAARPNHIWGTDITYIRLEEGWAYLVVVIDWFSRYVISWELSPTLEIDFCLQNLEQALSIASPEIHNSDQGSHFTSPRYTDLLTVKDIQISMDGRGRCMDNIFTERLWRTVKYEDVYLKSYRTIEEARAGLRQYFRFYNTQRRHSSLGYRTPAEVFFGNNDPKINQHYKTSNQNSQIIPLKLSAIAV